MPRGRARYRGRTSEDSGSSGMRRRQRRQGRHSAACSVDPVAPAFQASVRSGESADGRGPFGATALDGVASRLPPSSMPERGWPAPLGLVEAWGHGRPIRQRRCKVGGSEAQAPNARSVRARWIEVPCTPEGSAAPESHPTKKKKPTSARRASSGTRSCVRACLSAVGHAPSAPWSGAVNDLWVIHSGGWPNVPALDDDGRRSKISALDDDGRRSEGREAGARRFAVRGGAASEAPAADAVQECLVSLREDRGQPSLSISPSSRTSKRHAVRPAPCLCASRM